MNADEPLSSQTNSVTRLIQQLKGEDEQAAGQIWQRYFQRLLPLARAKLKALPHQAVDEEDVLVSVFDRLFRAVKEDRFVRLEDRDDLWQVLLMLTERKVADQYRKSMAQKRGGGKVANEAELTEVNLAEIRELADRDPNPELIVSFNETVGRAIHRLDEPKSRNVALLKLEGFSNREIADKVEISLSSVERKLRVIREVWQKEFAE
jgi:RNA polymerase sigma factor (sigma-70 family)